MNNKKGFTLLELVVTIAILVIIMLIAIPTVINVINNSKKNAMVSSSKILAKAIKSDSVSTGTKYYKLDSDGKLCRADETYECISDGYLDYNGKLISLDGASVFVSYSDGTIELKSGTICDKERKLCFEGSEESPINLLAVKKEDVQTDITTSTTTGSTSTAQSSTTTTSSGEVELLSTGDITKDGTSGSVTYSFYSNGNLVINGTGDGIMKDFAPGEGLVTIQQVALIQKINDNLEEGVELDQDTLNFFVYAYLSYGVTDFDSFLALAIASEATEEQIREMGLYFFGADYETVFDNLSVPIIETLTINNNVGEIGAMAFMAINLSNINIPNSVTKIGGGAFAQNSSPNVTISFGMNVTHIYDYAFYYITNLERVSFSSNLDYIGQWAFSHDSINSLTLNNGLERIASYAFEYNQLASVTIPESVTEINYQAFLKNPITSVVINSNETNIETRFNGAWESIGFPLELMPQEE